MTLDQLREELSRLESKVMAGHQQGYVLGTLLNKISSLRRRLMSAEQAQSNPKNVYYDDELTDDD
jgi:Mg2+ and Co2+ transporter CorA